MQRSGITEESILSVSKTTLSNARVNLTALAEFGVTETMLNQFDADIQAAEVLPGEKQQKIELGDLTQQKTGALDACYQWGRKLRMRLQLAFGKDSPQAKSFPGKDFQNAVHSENKMMSVMKVLISLAEKYQTELIPVGQTPEILSEGSELLKNLQTADSRQELQKDTRKQATQGRQQQFKNLYEMINKINNIGRMVFKDDPARLTLFASKWPTRRSGQSGQAEVETDAPSETN